MKFVIFSPPYNENNGGVIVLHKLCHLLNEIGQEAYMYPAYQPQIIGERKGLKPIFKVLESTLKWRLKKYRVNSAFKTPLFPLGRSIPDDFIVVYPEITLGNPLSARNVVRWLLHRPGFHTGRVCYGVGELYFDYDNFSNDISIPGSFLSQMKLYVMHMPLDLYNLEGSLPPEERSGTAYCLRKGRGRQLVHDMKDSILIDGKSHAEIATIFKRIKMFVTYDCYTAYSTLAALCGADVVVVPLEGVSKEEWYPHDYQRYGVAYGFQDLDLARATRHLLLPDLIRRESRMLATVEAFVDEIKNFYQSR